MMNRLLATPLRALIVACTGISILGGIVAWAADNYAATQGSGLTFGAKLISSVLYSEFLVCDATLGSTCAKVVAGNSAGTTDVAVVVADPNALATQGAPGDAAWVSGSGTQTAILKTISGNTGAAIPTQAPTVNIGAVGISQTTFGTTNGVVSAANTYNTIAASQTAQALTGGSGGATGDYLSHCVAVPATTSPGVVTILDNAGAVYSFPGGASSVSNLVPFTIPVGAKSTSGAWKVTTGANVSVVCVGKFT